jgi:hypothetical protein
VGELCGMGRVGVRTTNDIDALLALESDCVVYQPMLPVIAELERILRAGVNVVSTAGFLTGKYSEGGPRSNRSLPNSMMRST